MDESKERTRRDINIDNVKGYLPKISDKLLDEIWTSMYMEVDKVN